MNCDKKILLVVGSGSSEAITLLMRGVYQVEYSPSDTHRGTYETENYTIIVTRQFHRSDLNDINEFQRRIWPLKNELAAIICIENLNPRPERIGEDLRILKQVFSTAKLKRKLHFFFTFTNKSKSLVVVRNELAENFHGIFEDLKCNNRQKFVNKHVWILDERHIELLQDINYSSSFFYNSCR